MGSLYLDDILADHRAAAAGESRPLDELITEAKALPATRGFVDALRSQPHQA